MTTPPLTNPLLDPQHLAMLAQQAQQTAPPVIRPPSADNAPPPISTSPMGAGSPPTLPPPSTPQVSKLPTQTDTDKTELARKINTGSGINQISGKIQGAMPNHPLAGKLLGGAAQGLATLGDVGLRAVAPAVDLALPGTSLHHIADLRQGNRQVAADEANDQSEARTGAEQASTEGTRASTAKTYADLANLPQVTADRHALTQATIDKDQQDKVKSLTQMHAEAVAKAQAENRDPHTDKTVNDLADMIVSLQPGQNKEAPTAAPKTIQIEVGGKPHQMAWNPATKKYDLDQGISGEKPTQAPGITMIVPGPDGQQHVERLTAGQAVAPGAQTAAGLNSMNTPTTQQRTAAGRAETVIAMAPEVMARIDSIASKIGPIAGRWNDFMQGKVGSDDPDFAALRSDLLMMSSAVALAHAQGRLPENLREEFDHAINAPKQTPANLKATIQTMIPWLQQVQTQGQHATGGQQPQGGQSAPIVQHSPSTGQDRYSTDGGKTWQPGKPPSQ
jgi:hypothetical protein